MSTTESTIPTQMTAAVYYGSRDIRIEQREVPVPAQGEVLVRVLRSGMCGTDASEWKSGPRTFPVDGTPHPTSGHVGPMILGHEFIGEVVDSAHSDFEVGARVASGAGISCGSCVRCKEGRTNLCVSYVTLGLNRDGGMAEYVAVPTSTLARIPDALSDDHAALAQPLAVGLHAARRSRAQSGDRVVIIGSGAIGTFVLVGLLSLIDATVTVVDFAGPRLDRATRLGAHHTVAVGPDMLAEVSALVGVGGADVVIEASGAPGQLDAALRMTRRGGVVLQVGLPAQPQPLDVHHLVMNEITIETTLAHVCGADLVPALDILGATELAELLVQSTHPLDELPDQLDLLLAGEIPGKVLFDPARS